VLFLWDQNLFVDQSLGSEDLSGVNFDDAKCAPECTKASQQEEVLSSMPLSQCLSVLVWADNIFTFWTSPSAAVDAMQHSKTALLQGWSLHSEPESLELMAMPGATLPDPVLMADCKRQDTVATLGHLLAADADSAPCLARTVKACWAALWRNYGASCKAVGRQSKGRLCDRAVTGVMTYRAPRWHWSATTAKFLVTQQVRMLCTLCRLRPERGQTLRELWHTKRELLADCKVAAWDARFREVMAAWRSHLDRHPAQVAAKMRRLLPIQLQLNNLCRTAGVLSGRPSALESRKVMGPPRRWIDSWYKMRA
jgi:hypothetical protein